jgi:hypothetical protein
MNSTINVRLLGEIINIIGYYAIPYTSGFGFLLNLISITVLVNPILKHEIYTFLLAKCVLHSISCINMVFFQNLLCVIDCTRNFTQSYNTFVFYCLKCLGDIIYVCSAICEVTLAYDRYVTLKRKKNLFSRVRPLYLVMIYIIFSICLFMPDFFAFDIVDISVNHTVSIYIMRDTPFGASKIYSIYLIAVLMSEAFCTITSLITLNIIVLLSYKKYIKKKFQNLNMVINSTLN